MSVDALLFEHRFRRSSYTVHAPATRRSSRWARWGEYALSVIERPLYWVHAVVAWEPQAYREDFPGVKAW